MKASFGFGKDVNSGKRVKLRDLQVMDSNGDSRRMKWRDWWRDAEVRASFRDAKRHRKSGDSEMVVVATLDCGMEVKMPIEIATDWLMLPEPVRSEFLATLNEQVNEKKMRDATG